MDQEEERIIINDSKPRNPYPFQIYKQSRVTSFFNLNNVNNNHWKDVTRENPENYSVCVLSCEINGLFNYALIDSGAFENFVSPEFVDYLKAPIYNSTRELEAIVGNGESMISNKEVFLTIKILGIEEKIKFHLIAPWGCDPPICIGYPGWKQLQLVIDCSMGTPHLVSALNLLEYGKYLRRAQKLFEVRLEDKNSNDSMLEQHLSIDSNLGESKAEIDNQPMAIDTFTGQSTEVSRKQGEERECTPEPINNSASFDQQMVSREITNQSQTALPRESSHQLSTLRNKKKKLKEESSLGKIELEQIENIGKSDVATSRVKTDRNNSQENSTVQSYFPRVEYQNLDRQYTKITGMIEGAVTTISKERKIPIHAEASEKFSLELRKLLVKYEQIYCDNMELLRPLELNLFKSD